METHRITNKTAISRRREKSRRVEKGKGCTSYSRERWSCQRIIVASQRTRQWQALVPLQIRQAVASDKGVPTAQSQPPERTRIRRQAAETAKERIRQDIADDEDDWTLLLNGNKDGLKVELQSVTGTRRGISSHSFKPDVTLLSIALYRVVRRACLEPRSILRSV